MGRTPNFDLRDHPPFQNLIINGGFDVWQRSTLQNISGGGQYVADRFISFNSIAAAILRVERRNDLLPNNLTPFHMKLEVALGTGSVGAGDTCTLEYRMEGYDWAQVVDGPFTLFFFLRSTRTATLAFSARTLGLTQSFVKELSISETNTWIPFSVVVPKAPTGSHNLSNLEGIRLNWTLSAGTNFQTSTLEQWAPGNKIASTSQSHFLQNTNDSLRISQIYCVRGDLSDHFPTFLRAGKDISDEITRCQRYFETPIRVQHSTQAGHDFGTSMSMNFKVKKRTVPNIIVITEFDTNSYGATEDYVTVNRPFPRNLILGEVSADAEL